MYFLHETFFKRDDKMIQWCLKEATAKGLREWGGLALDKMKIQIHVPLCIIFRIRHCFLVHSVSTMLVFTFARFWVWSVLSWTATWIGSSTVYTTFTQVIICFILYVSLHLQENLEMMVKNGKHKLVGLVNLGGMHTVMKMLSGNVIFNSYNIAQIH
jgi:hypothetical protein